MFFVWHWLKILANLAESFHGPQNGGGTNSLLLAHLKYNGLGEIQQRGRGDRRLPRLEKTCYAAIKKVNIK